MFATPDVHTREKQLERELREMRARFQEVRERGCEKVVALEAEVTRLREEQLRLEKEKNL